AVVLYKMRIEGFSYFEKRFRSWRDPFSDISGDTWQTYQSLVAIGSGGFFGMGLGNSRQKFQYLPETKNDFVFSIVCEELGFVGAATVIALFAFFVFRGFYIASKAPDKFGMLMCIGLTSQIGFQAFLNIAVVSNFIPNTGISLPFFSYGGTALMMLLAQVGIILNISRQALMDVPDETPDKTARRKKVVKAVSKK
ncbi:MAG: FtsW/RodA/SpoVE family cell cycle protein, partial [Oscillospiraceae bacterium]